MAIIGSLESCELLYSHVTDRGTFVLNTSEVRKMLDGSSIRDNGVLLWIREYVNENIQYISTI